MLRGGRPARYPGGVTGERRRPAAFSSGGASRWTTGSPRPTRSPMPSPQPRRLQETRVTTGSPAPQIQHWAQTPIACPHACCYSRGAFRPRGGDAWPAPKARGSYLCGPSGWLRAEATLPLDVGDRSEEDGFEPPREDADAGCCSAPYRAERSPAWVWPLAAYVAGMASARTDVLCASERTRHARAAYIPPAPARFCGLRSAGSGAMA